MRHNVRVLFAVCVGYGFCTGLTDFAVPFYLSDHGISFQGIGYIFSASARVIFLLRLYLARLSDLVGRKLLYLGSLAVTSLSYLGFPYVRNLFGLAALRTGADLSFGVRETMHATALYESRREGYLNLQGKMRGTEMAFTALGTIVAAYLLFDYRLAFAVPFVVLAGTLIVLGLWFEEPAELAVASRARLGLLKLLTTSFPRQIVLLAVSGVIFGVAISASHRYVPPLFFELKFGLPKPVIGQIQVVHILSHVPALFLVGWLVTRRLRGVFFWTLLVEGVFLALSGCFARRAPTLFFWWTHDIIGAGFWAPIQWALIQRHARKESRGLDASVVPAVTALGYILGPLMAGWLAGLRSVPFTALAVSPAAAISLPIIASGAIMVVAALPLLLLPPDPANGTSP